MTSWDLRIDTVALSSELALSMSTSAKRLNLTAYPIHFCFPTSLIPLTLFQGGGGSQAPGGAGTRGEPGGIDGGRLHEEEGDFGIRDERRD